MSDFQLGVAESRFAGIIWEKEPLSSGELVKLSEEKLGWKKSTAFPVLKRLSEIGLFKNERGEVSSLVSKDEFYSLQSEKFVKETCDGALPAFFASFTKRKSLTAQEVKEIRRMIDDYKED